MRNSSSNITFIFNVFSTYFVLEIWVFCLHVHTYIVLVDFSVPSAIFQIFTQRLMNYESLTGSLGLLLTIFLQLKLTHSFSFKLL